MSAPVRIQLSRKLGWRMPPNTVKVDRSNKVFGNPYKISSHPGIDIAADAVIAFKNLIWRTEDGAHISELARRELRGKNLACWCKLCEKHKTGLPLGIECKDCAPCHANVLLTEANG